MRKFQGSKVESDTTKQDVTDQKKFFQFHGESYHSFLECCKLHGVSYDAVRNYQKYHEITKEEALEHYISMDKAFLFRNVIYDDFFLAAKHTIFHQILLSIMKRTEKSVGQKRWNMSCPCEKNGLFPIRVKSILLYKVAVRNWG